MAATPAFALVLVIAALGLGVGTPEAPAANAVSAAVKKPAAKKKGCKKTHKLHKGKCVRRPCKKTHKLQKGKCVPKPKPKPPAPNPLSDSDGDGLPYAWEVAQATPPPPKPKKCTAKQRLSKGKCVPKCKKGRKLKGGKCVKRKKQSSKQGHAKAQASIAPASVAPLGADPDHKDVFVQIDYASQALRQNVACAELDAIVAAFASAPVANPDGRTGIALHIDAGVSCPSRSYDLGGSAVFDAGACPSTSATFNAVEPPESRVGTFHIAGFSPTCGGSGEGGAATLHGTEMVVFTEGSSFAHVLMHELGHNLGLDHPFPGQPNRISTMNARLHASNDGNGAAEILDFQRFNLPALDESNLSETAGLSAPPEAHRFYIPHFCAGEGFRNAWPGDGSIDWNCNSPSILLPWESPTIDPGTFAVDVNGDGQLTLFPATGNEWVTLDYASGGGIGPR